jgi:hypothetical protein
MIYPGVVSIWPYYGTKKCPSIKALESGRKRTPGKSALLNEAASTGVSSSGRVSSMSSDAVACLDRTNVEVARELHEKDPKQSSSRNRKSACGNRDSGWISYFHYGI